MRSIVAGKAILLTYTTTIFRGYTKILVIQRYYPHFDSWYWFSAFVWWTMVFRWELLQWIYCLLVAGNTLLLLFEVWTELWQTLKRKWQTQVIISEKGRRQGWRDLSNDIFDFW